MATSKQNLGAYGEKLVCQKVRCPSCKRVRSLRRLPANFKCADLICDFCGYLCQVKTTTVSRIDAIPDRVLGAAWKVQKERMDFGIYFPLFWVLRAGIRKCAIYYLPADLQERFMFKPRKKLSSKARRAGWQGFTYELQAAKSRLTRLF